LALLSER